MTKEEINVETKRAKESIVIAKMEIKGWQRFLKQAEKTLKYLSSLHPNSN